MHDVVRDFDLMEVANGEHVYMVRHDAKLKEWLQNDVVEPYTAISIGSREQLELPPSLDCPSLQLLQFSGEGSTQISRDYFGGMKELRVVSFSGQLISFDSETMLLESPPKTLQFFMNVRTLCLEHCRFSKDIGFIGSMHKLEILSFFNSEIDVLPSQIGQLSNLKLLDLRRCTVGLISPGVLSCLRKLEDLYMGNYFRGKGVEECNNQVNCASITELCSLLSLKTLQVSVSEPEVLVKLKDFFFDELTRFNIVTDSVFVHYIDSDYENKLRLDNVDLGLFSGSQFEPLIRRTEILRLYHVKGWKNMIKESDEDAFINLKKLLIFDNDDLVEMCDGILPTRSMGMLEEVDLSRLSSMMHLWRVPIQPPCLVNLKVFEMTRCDKITSLFPPRVVRCLVQLQKLDVSWCEMLEEIVSHDGAEDDKDEKMIEFPKLNLVGLQCLPSLKSFILIRDTSSSNDNHDKSILNEVLLPSMETLSLSSIKAANIVVGQMQPSSLYKLRFLLLHGCDNLPCIAALEVIKVLQNLEELQVHLGNSMETLFDFKGPEVFEEQGAEVMMLGQLETISILWVQELRYIWKNAPKHGFQCFHKLRFLNVDSCLNIQYLLSPSMTKLLVNLQVLKLTRCWSMKQVIQMDEDGEEKEEICRSIGKKMDTIVFPQLSELRLSELGKLTSFCQGSNDLEFPLLEKVSVKTLPNMKNFCSGSLSAAKLECVKFSYDSYWMGDLDSTIRHINQRYMAPRREESLEEDERSTEQEESGKDEASSEDEDEEQKEEEDDEEV